MPHFVVYNALIFEMNEIGKLEDGSRYHILERLLFTRSMISKEGLALMVIVLTEKYNMIIISLLIGIFS